MPKDVIADRCARYMRNGKPAQRGALLADDDFTIVAKYQAEYRAVVQYYLLAQDAFRLGKLGWVMETSLLKTLAGQAPIHGHKDGSKVQNNDRDPQWAAQVLASLCRAFWKEAADRPLRGIPLKRQRTAVLSDLRPVMASTRRNELIHRLLAERCEICEGGQNLQVHHIRKLADLD